jgi:hypothetical protein
MRLSQLSEEIKWTEAVKTQAVRRGLAVCLRKKWLTLNRNLVDLMKKKKFHLMPSLPSGIEEVSPTTFSEEAKAEWVVGVCQVIIIATTVKSSWKRAKIKREEKVKIGNKMTITWMRWVMMKVMKPQVWAIQALAEIVIMEASSEKVKARELKVQRRAIKKAEEKANLLMLKICRLIMAAE